MFRRLFCYVFLTFCVASCLTCHAFAVNTSAASFVLMEQGSGRMLLRQEADEPRLIASITKIITAVVALERGDLRERYTVTAEDMAEGSSMYLKPGEELELEALLYGLMLASGNDAALAVAHCVSGSVEKFVAEMNAMAARLGMSATHFENPNGLDGQKHYSTAADMAKLTAYALENGDFRRIVSTVSVTLGERYLTNHNKLLHRYSGCIGVKTGYTKAAGRTLVSAVERQGMTLICVTLCDGDDWNDHMTLYDWAFETYTLKTVARAGEVLGCAAVSGGSVPWVMAAVEEELAFPVKDGEKLTLEVQLPAFVAAPVIPGQVLGSANVLLDGQTVRTVPLVAVGTSAAQTTNEKRTPSLWERFFG